MDDCFLQPSMVSDCSGDSVLADDFVVIVSLSLCAQVAMISPGISCCDHSLNTLRYADRYDLGHACALHDCWLHGIYALIPPIITAGAT